LRLRTLHAIRHLYLLADQGEGGRGATPLQVVLFELEEVAMARLRSLAANFLNRGSHYLLMASGDPPGTPTGISPS
jgi:hypothetical protein